MCIYGFTQCHFPSPVSCPLCLLVQFPRPNTLQGCLISPCPQQSFAMGKNWAPGPCPLTAQSWHCHCRVHTCFTDNFGSSSMGSADPQCQHLPEPTVQGGCPHNQSHPCSSLRHPAPTQQLRPMLSKEKNGTTLSSQ